jgi:hypothetical protein
MKFSACDVVFGILEANKPQLEVVYGDCEFIVVSYILVNHFGN